MYFMAPVRKCNMLDDLALQTATFLRENTFNVPSVEVQQFGWNISVSVNNIYKNNIVIGTTFFLQ